MRLMQITYDKLLLSLAAASLVQLSACAGVLAQQQQWSTFTPPDKDFAIAVPGVVRQRAASGERSSLDLYQCESANVNYVITATTLGVQQDALPQFLEGVKKGIAGRGGDISSEMPVSGVDWNGTLISADFGKGQNSTTLVAQPRGVFVVYVASVNLPAMDTDSQHFIKSLVIYPARASLAHPLGKQLTREPAPEPWRARQGVGFFDLTSLIQIVLILAVLGVVAFACIKYGIKRK